MASYAIRSSSTLQTRAPHACRATPQFAHHACIQRWIFERPDHHLTCEVCGQPFRGMWQEAALRPEEQLAHLPALARYILLGRAEWDPPMGQRRAGGGSAWGLTLLLTACCFLLVRHIVMPVAVAGELQATGTIELLLRTAASWQQLLPCRSCLPSH